MLIRLKSFEAWLYGLVHGVIGGVCTAALAKFVLPNTIIDFEDLWKLAASAAVFNAIIYLKQRPLPEISSGDTEITTNEKTP